MEEVWKDIPEYEGFYQASNFGRIRSITRKHPIRGRGQRGVKGRVIKETYQDNGYKMVTLSVYGKASNKSVHRLVLSAFEGKSDLQVNHKNGVKDDNLLENLEYCTQSANVRHAYKLGLIRNQRGEKCSWSKITEKQARKILTFKGKTKYGDIKKLSEKFKISAGIIGHILRGKGWKHLED